MSKSYAFIPGLADLLSAYWGAAFLLNRAASTRTATHWSGGFELFYGAIIFIFAEGLHRHHVPLLRGENADS